MSNIAALTNVSSDYVKAAAENGLTANASEESFDSVMNTAMNMIDETNASQKDYQAAEMQFALGEAENTHDLQIAQEKANITLQYTVAVRDKVLSAYREIMNMQI